MSFHNIILIGATGVGKTSTGFELAHLLNLGFYDTDFAIAQRKKLSIVNLFKTLGEEEFRQAEADCLAAVAEAKSFVIATGAGFVAHSDHLKKLKNIGILVWLRVPPAQVCQRFLNAPAEIEQRPLLEDVLQIKDDSRKKEELILRLQTLSDQRQEFYRQADIEVDGSFLTQSTFVRAIAEKIKLFAKAS